jgi:hypothetical protein
VAWFSVDATSWAKIDPSTTSLIEFLRPADLDD